MRNSLTVGPIKRGKGNLCREDLRRAVAVGHSKRYFTDLPIVKQAWEASSDISSKTKMANPQAAFLRLRKLSRTA